MRALPWAAAVACAAVLVIWTTLAWPFLLPVQPEVRAQLLLADLPGHGAHSDSADNDQINGARRIWADGALLKVISTPFPGDARSTVLERYPLTDEVAVHVPPTHADHQQTVCFYAGSGENACQWQSQYGQFIVVFVVQGAEPISALPSTMTVDIVAIDEQLMHQFRHASLPARAVQQYRLLLPELLIITPWVLLLLACGLLAAHQRHSGRPDPKAIGDRDPPGGQTGAGGS